MVRRLILIGTPETMTTSAQVKNTERDDIPAGKKVRTSRTERKREVKGQNAKMHAIFGMPLEIVLGVRPFTSLHIQ